MKKVITGHTGAGKSIFKRVETDTLTVDVPTVAWHEIWATHPQDSIPIDQSDAQVRDAYSDRHKAFPTTNQTLFRVLDFKPGDLVFNEDLVKKASEELPGLMEHMELDDPGMHTTDSVDYGVIISGRITLELDDGEQVELEAGDVFVQNGTRHAWRVSEPCRMAVVLVGMPRKAD